MDQSTIENKASTKQKSNIVFANIDDHQTMVSEAAYYLAEKRGFIHGDPVQDWLEAEKSIELKINDKA
jgi:hypothetical protein